MFKDLFDLSQTAQAALFKKVKYPWEILPLLKDYLGDRKVIGHGTVVEPGAVIKGPAIIGRNCVIRSGAYLRANVILGDNVVVGQSCELKNCLVFNDAQIPHLNYVGDSIIGYHVHLGAGVVLSNVKTPPSEISVKMEGREIKTGLRKFGALIGDQTEIGCNSVINPGSVIGRNCSLYALTNWRGYLPADSLVKIRQQQEIVEKKG